MAKKPQKPPLLKREHMEHFFYDLSDLVEDVDKFHNDFAVSLKEAQDPRLILLGQMFRYVGADARLFQKAFFKQDLKPQLHPTYRLSDRDTNLTLKPNPNFQLMDDCFAVLHLLKPDVKVTDLQRVFINIRPKFQIMSIAIEYNTNFCVGMHITIPMVTVAKLMDEFVLINQFPPQQGPTIRNYTFRNAMTIHFKKPDPPNTHATF